MVFSSVLFIFVFIPLFFFIYYFTPKRGRNWVACIGSYLFYAFGAPKIVGLLFISSAADYILSHLFQRAKGSARGKALFILALVLNIGLLLYYKYANFFVVEMNTLLRMGGINEVSWTAIALPIGISFFTFQKLSYLIDVYREEAQPAESLIDYLLYVVLFPQLIAGPIVRYHDIAAQLRDRKTQLTDVSLGAYRFCIGLSRKVLIADPLGEVADVIFGMQPELLTSGVAWLGVLCYTFQIYFDFCGYSDMAIGLGRMMGFRLLENFYRPYISRSITEFWRRWHISLSRWMKDYLYIPLGGNRKGNIRCYWNLWIVFLISGLWHGASWSFVVWGGYHGFWITLEKMGLARILKKLPGSISTLLTFFIVVVGWVLFRAESLSHALSFLRRMFLPAASPSVESMLVLAEVSNRSLAMLAAAILLVFLAERWALPLDEKKGVLVADRIATWRFAMAALFFVFSVLALVNSQYHPFIYFRF